jgi:head-tail adaptor
VRARRLGQRVRLARPERVGGVTAFIDEGEVWAHVRPLGGEDLRLHFEITLRRREDIAPGWRLLTSNRRLRVTAVAPTAHDRFLTVSAEADYA